jgi:symplekin
LEQSEIIKHLPRVVGLLNGSEKQRKIVKEVFLRLIDTAVTSVSGEVTEEQVVHSTKAILSPPLSPVELMLAIHNMEATVGLKKAIEGFLAALVCGYRLIESSIATQICFSLPHVFKQEILAVILQQLIDQPKLPTLVMRTVRSLFCFLKPFLTIASAYSKCARVQEFSEIRQ